MSKMSEQEREELQALTSILKQKLIRMMITKWNGKDFTSLDQIGEMADDIIKVISEVGNNK
tara:strand:- start:611 stop:793 length:183 start_codon:yes stop_codon:yes gene_type:complete